MTSIRLFHRALILLIVSAALLAFPQTPAAAGGTPGKCTGSFVNPVTDVCWSCLFPLSVGGLKIWPSNRPDTDNPDLPVCACGVRPGLAIGFWEPVRLADVSMKPWCFVNLGGMKLDPGFDIGFKSMSGPSAVGGASQYASQWHVHWYMYPLLYWMEIVTDFLCLSPGSIDLLYVTELDPLWQDSELTTLINPEAVLFSNPAALAACAADCVAATAKLPSDKLFWCAGCQGGMYPMNGNISATIGHVQASRLALSRFAYKSHRQLASWGTMGKKGLCGKYPMPVMRKQQYRFQAVNPNPSTSGRYACPPDRCFDDVQKCWTGLSRHRRGHGLSRLAQTQLLRAMRLIPLLLGSLGVALIALGIAMAGAAQTTPNIDLAKVRARCEYLCGRRCCICGNRRRSAATPCARTSPTMDDGARANRDRYADRLAVTDARQA